MFNEFIANFEKVFCNANVQIEAMNWLTTTWIINRDQLQEYTNCYGRGAPHLLLTIYLSRLYAILSFLLQ